MGERSSEYQAATDADYRAIGRFVVQFARLVHELRMGTYYLAGGGMTQQDYSLLTGEMTAQPLANTFFAVIRRSADAPTGESLQILGRIESDISDVIRQRNDAMHGDWYVGFGEPGAELPGPSILLRTKPSRRSAALSVLEFSTADLEALTERVDTVRRYVQQLTLYFLFGPAAAPYEGRSLAELFEIVDGRANYREGAPGALFDA